jgi:REP element-mobilizing transposase RayT
MRSNSKQMKLQFRSHGGARQGAGRKPLTARPPVHHVRRPVVPRSCPSHVTLRVRPGFPSLRNLRFIHEFQSSLRRACERADFRVCHYSIQRDHLHLVVESEGKEALGRGMKSITARTARAVHRVFERRGPVLFGRYHLHVLRTPREMRHALAYVLLNARKHCRQRHGSPPPARLDVASSGAGSMAGRDLHPRTNSPRRQGLLSLEAGFSRRGGAGTGWWIRARYPARPSVRTGDRYTPLLEDLLADRALSSHLTHERARLEPPTSSDDLAIFVAP